MKKLTLLTSLFVFTLLLAGCKSQMSKGPAIEDSEMMETSQTAEEDALPEQPPVSSSTEVEDIEAELDGTVILEEDFSDLE